MNAKRELGRIIEDSDTGKFIVQVCVAKGLKIGNSFENLAQAILDKLPELVEIDEGKILEIMTTEVVSNPPLTNKQMINYVAHAIASAKPIRVKS